MPTEQIRAPCPLSVEKSWNRKEAEQWYGLWSYPLICIIILSFKHFSFAKAEAQSFWCNTYSYLNFSPIWWFDIWYICLSISECVSMSVCVCVCVYESVCMCVCMITAHFSFRHTVVEVLIKCHSTSDSSAFHCPGLIKAFTVCVTFKKPSDVLIFVLTSVYRSG